jgi:hypothetical protein
MKKISLILATLLLATSWTYSQNVDDALRYSQIFYQGTARFNSMGGAFTALGGDMSTLSQNPAGIGLFRSSEISFSPQLYYNNTSANFNRQSSDYVYDFNLGQIGIVTHLISSKGTTGLISLNIGYSFNKTNNLNSTVNILGTGTSNSMADSWADQGYGTTYTNLSGAAGIAYDAWVIDTITGTGAKTYGTVFNNYGDNLNSTYGQSIRRRINNEGYMGEHAISIGGNFSNKLFFGATLGINTLRYTGNYVHTESADYNLDSGFENFTYTEHYEDNGTGVAFKLGTIIKPTENLRIGLAFHAPTTFKIDEYYYDKINSSFTGNETYSSDNQPSRYSYKLTTPFRALAGIAYQFEKVALLSFDYEFVDYSTARFSDAGDNYDYTGTNDGIRGTLKPASNIRLGGEYRLDKFYLRGGYGHYGKMFKQGEENENLNYNSYSFGLGFREQNLNIDFGFVNTSDTERYILYSVYSASTANNTLPVSAELNPRKNMFTVTIGYKFGY